MSFLTNLEWRYATKRFDTEKKVSDADLEKILHTIRLTPTSTNVQPYHFYVITRQDIKDKIQEVSWNQPQIGTSSHLLVFAARTDIEQNKEDLFQMISGWDKEVRAKFAWYEGMVDGLISMLRGNNLVSDWAARQTYIALGFALAATAELQIDSCPMEWFDPKAVSEIIGTPSEQRVLAMLPIWYRVTGEGPRSSEKVRFPKESLFTYIG